MKKRIISLILVVAMMFLVLTGCSFNYSKADLSQYATLNGDFKNAIKNLSIDDADFTTDEATRWAKVEDAIAKALLSVVEADKKSFEGTPDLYDNLSFCYVAMYDGKIIYTSKMDASSPTTIQLGLSSLKDLNAAISEKILSLSDEELVRFYQTSKMATGDSKTVVGEKDIVAVSYTKGDTEVKYELVKTETAGFGQWLVGKPVGATLKKEYVTTDATYSNIKVESVLVDAKDTAKVTANSTIFITYTEEITYTDAEATKISIEGYTESGDGKFTKKYDTAPLTVGVADAADATEKTFAGQLVGLKVGTASDIKGINKTVSVTTTKGDAEPVKEDKGVSVNYTGITIHYVVNGAPVYGDQGFADAITVEYAPAKTVTGVKSTTGETVTFDGETKATYYIYPVSYLPVDNAGVTLDENGKLTGADVNAETLIREFYSTLTKVEPHEHEEGEEHSDDEKTVYEFDTLNNENYKNGNDTLATLLTALSTLYSGDYATKESALTKAKESLVTALKNLAKDSTKEAAATEARNAYNKAKNEFKTEEEKVEDQIDKILACSSIEDVKKGLAKDYAEYQYDTLESTYKNDMNKAVYSAIFALLDYSKEGSMVTFKELPKKAVDEAYDAIINTYKYNFYEGKNSTTNKTYYEESEGNFETFLKTNVKDASGKTYADIDAVYAALELQAQDDVREIILIYLLAKEFDLELNKDEIKQYKKEYKNDKAQADQYYQLAGLFTYLFGYDPTATRESDYLNAKQFDKVVKYFLETEEVPGNNIVYKNVGVTVKTAESK